ncbi:MAG: hypothetical protein KIT22_00925 [Verrucomicrobiae bacterium]|nr:hypothetical protein [Verrucomicrobiae bacterium]
MCRHGPDDGHGGAPVRSVPLGTLRPPDPAALVSLRRHGKPAPDLGLPDFVTGDWGSLVSLVAHELAHSWSGNLVTFSSNRDMWLNEGFTTYVEGRITEALYGRERADMEDITARNELKAEFTDANKPLQSLVIAPGASRLDPDCHLSYGLHQGAWFCTEDQLHALRLRCLPPRVFRSFCLSVHLHAAIRRLRPEASAPEIPRQGASEEFDAWLYEPVSCSTAPSTVSPVAHPDAA